MSNLNYSKVDFWDELFKQNEKNDFEWFIKLSEISLNRNKIIFNQRIITAHRKWNLKHRKIFPSFYHFLNLFSSTTTENQFVPETVLKRRNRDVKTAEQRAMNRKHKVSTSRNKQDEPIKRVEKYVKEYKQQQKSFVDIKRRVILTTNAFFAKLK